MERQGGDASIVYLNAQEAFIPSSDGLAVRPRPPLDSSHAGKSISACSRPEQTRSQSPLRTTDLTFCLPVVPVP